MAITSASAMTQIDIPTFQIPVSHKKAPRQLSKKSRNVLAAIRLLSHAYYLFNPKNFNISSVFAATWGIVDLTEIIESIAGEEIDNDSLLDLAPEEQAAINNRATVLKSTLLPVVTTVLPALSAWYTYQENHETALKLISLDSLARTALKYLECPKSLEKRLYGTIFALHVLATVYAFHNAKALTTIEASGSTGQGSGTAQPGITGNPGDARKESGDKSKDQQPASDASGQPSATTPSPAVTVPYVAVIPSSEHHPREAHERLVALVMLKDDEFARILQGGSLHLVASSAASATAPIVAIPVSTALAIPAAPTSTAATTSSTTHTESESVDLS